MKGARIVVPRAREVKGVGDSSATPPGPPTGPTDLAGDAGEVLHREAVSFKAII